MTDKQLILAALVFVMAITTLIKFLWYQENSKSNYKKHSGKLKNEYLNTRYDKYSNIMYGYSDVPKKKY